MMNFKAYKKGGILVYYQVNCGATFLRNAEMRFYCCFYRILSSERTSRSSFRIPLIAIHTKTRHTRGKNVAVLMLVIAISPIASTLFVKPMEYHNEKI